MIINPPGLMFYLTVSGLITALAVYTLHLMGVL